MTDDTDEYVEVSR